MLDIVGAYFGGGVLSLYNEPDLEAVEVRDSTRRFFVRKPKSLAMIEDGSEPGRLSSGSTPEAEAAVDGRLPMPWIKALNLRLTVEFIGFESVSRAALSNQEST
jgi:hypothetical protein